MYAVQDRLIFMPGPPSSMTPADVKLAFEDLALSTPDGATIDAWFVPHDAPRATILITYGNASNMAEQLTTAKTFHRLDYATMLLEYPGYGRSAGKPGEQPFYAAAEAAWRYLIEVRGLTPGQIVLFGRSIGGAVAIELAHRHAPAALIVESSFTSMVDMGQAQYPLLPIRLIARHRFTSIEKVPQIACPKLFLHGERDTLVPIAMARRLFDAAAEPKHFIATPGDHNSSGFEYSHATIDAVAEWLADALGRGGA